jgi:uncharacterized membrane protein
MLRKAHPLASQRKIMNNNIPKKTSYIHRVSGRLHRVQPILDAAGKVIHYAVSPLRVELKRRDITQIIAGASILAVPVAFTQETWDLGQSLPLLNIVFLTIISLAFISAYVFFNFYRDLFDQYFTQFIKRVLAIYFISLFIVGVLLTIIQVAPWADDFLLALKRTIIVGFPASMSAAISDSID